MHSLLRLGIVVLVGTVILVTSWKPGQGQVEPVPSREPAIYKAQIREAITLSRKTLRDLQAIPNDDNIPIDPKVIHDAHTAYVMVRVVRHGMGWVKERQTSPDPVFELAFKRVDEAWDLTRFPVDGRTMQRTHYLAEAIPKVQKAIRLLEQALVILP
jgi:hypothetical protein